jgi:predicted ABC-type transport system involved in lysophospholipase L1 biosynthesis ATPase subunit
MPELLLRLEGVGYEYRRGRDWWQVLSGVDLAVAVGEFVGVLGGRGEGKTTLLEVAAGLRVPGAGSVWFGGMDLARCADDERSELLGDRIAWMPRGDFGEFRALQYVALPLAMGSGGMAAAEERAMAALRRVGAESGAGSSWEELSDWDRLMVTFARGYATRPRLMVVDDLLDGLGAGGTRQAAELLLAFAGELGCGVLVAASDMSALLAAHRVVSFDGEGGLNTMTESPPNPTNIVDFPDAAEAG